MAEIAALFVAHGADPFKLARVIDPELHASLLAKGFAVATWEPLWDIDSSLPVVSWEDDVSDSGEFGISL